MTRGMNTARIGVAVVILVAVVATYVETASRTTVNPFNFFGFFTIQVNTIFAVVLLLTAVQLLRGRATGPVLDIARGAATTYIAIVGAVYALLLAPLHAEGGIPVPWANFVLHVIAPVYGILDWVLARDSGALPWNRLWVVTVYPTLWLAVVLVRGATDGWIPYPFLDPANGYGSVAVYGAFIAVAMVAGGAVVWWVSRLKARQRP